MSEEEEDTWAQCDGCGKWRRLVDGGQQALGEVWLCSMNTADPDRADCSAPAEDYSDVDSSSDDDLPELELYQQMFLKNRDRLVGNDPDAEALFLEAIREGGLLVSYYKFDEKKLDAAIEDIIGEKKKVFVNLHKARKDKGEWYGTGGRAFTDRLVDILCGHEEFVGFLRFIEDTFEAEIMDVFLAWYAKMEEGNETIEGYFGPHRDKFKHVDFRIPSSLGDSEEGKTMTFIKDKGSENERRFTIRASHGTVIAMSRTISGATHDDGDDEELGRWWHMVEGAAATYTLGIQIRLRGEEETEEEDGEEGGE